MTPELLKYLCDPLSGLSFKLEQPAYSADGRIESGLLVSNDGSTYRVVNGIPRFVPSKALARTVSSFGEEWNYFNFTAFKQNWLTHAVANTFGNAKAFEGKVIVDAGGGSGAQTLWMLEAGAKHVIMLDLSNSVDHVVRDNLGTSGFKNYDVIQCSIDAPPLRKESIDGIVYCHNVIQHTPSVERTAKALYALVAPGGELVFNVYPVNDAGLPRWLRFHLIYKGLRSVLSRLPFRGILLYAKTMAYLREVPGLGPLLEKAGVMIRGDVPLVEGESSSARRARSIKASTLNTYDWFGFHEFQHHKTEKEVRALLRQLQPDETKIRNVEKYFSHPPPIGCALRVAR